jgi:hypothetical protein
MCVNTMRVAIRGAISEGAPFVVQPLKTGQPLPEGTMEAMIVLTGEVAGAHTMGSLGSWEYRAIEAWLHRCKSVINQHGKKALQFFGWPRSSRDDDAAAPH